MHVEECLDADRQSTEFRHRSALPAQGIDGVGLDPGGLFEQLEERVLAGRAERRSQASLEFAYRMGATVGDVVANRDQVGLTIRRREHARLDGFFRAAAMLCPGETNRESGC